MAFDLEGARKAGYSDQEIADHLSQTSKFDAAGARQSGYTDAEIIGHLSGAQQPAAPPEQDEQTPIPWGDVATGAAVNAIPSVFNLGKGVVSAVAHPIDTASNVLSLASGGVLNAMPEKGVEFVNKYLADPEQSNKDMALASALGGLYKEKYGSMEGFKNAIATDPAGVLADVATVLTGGGAAATKLGQVSKVGGLETAGRLAQKAGVAVDPLANAVKIAGKGAVLAGSGAANVIGGLGTHTGGKSIQDAARAGFAGGEKSADFIANMRGNTSIENVLAQAKDALTNIRKARGESYRKSMAGVSADKTVLDFNPIEKSLFDALDVSTYKGKSINRSTAAVQEKIFDVVKEWKRSPKKDFHTAEGLDALKQTIGDIRDSTDFGTPSRVVADRVYNSVKGQIVKQAPEYATAMKDYETASTLVKDIEKSLSLGNKASADTAIRKLQSLTRNNANTNYGKRVELAQELEAAGAGDLLSNLSGQALNTWMPRGLGGLVAGGVGAGGLMTMNPLAIPIVAAQSPRLMGEAALKTGQLARLMSTGTSTSANALRKYGIDPVALSNYLYQANKPNELVQQLAPSDEQINQLAPYLN
jgi:hypothetical protein